MAVGCVIAAVAIDMFLTPNRIAPGGVTLISTAINYLSGGVAPIGIILIVLNIPILVVGIAILGVRLIARSIFCTVLLSAAVDLLRQPIGFVARTALKISPHTNNKADMMLFSIAGGFLIGIGVGLVLRANATTGGSDIIAKIINYKKPYLTVGRTLLFTDIIIISLSSFLMGSWILALYSAISLVVSTKAVDYVLEGAKFSKTAFIISSKPDEISKVVMDRLSRGVTALNGVGMYTGGEKKVLMCVVPRNIIHELKTVVREIDPYAFMVVADVREVYGEGFMSLHD
jgi:uncharacterized membrane-anchored protein YitT (DUF2179 family)